MSWGFSHYSRVHGVDSERLARRTYRTVSDSDVMLFKERTVHKNIDEKDLHCIKGVAESKERAQRD